MKNIFSFIAVIILFSCTSNSKNNNSNKSDIISINTDTLPNYFPVTNYLKGEIFNIKRNGISPLYQIKIGDNQDSTWLKMDSLETFLNTFLIPKIDTANLKAAVQESSFADLTLGTFTFTYSMRKNVSDTFAFKNWDVLIDKETNEVKRVYLVKKINENTIAQLTWISGKYCKIIYLKEENGKTVIEKEEKLTWGFD